jgi:hypothetical protein
MLRFSEVTAKKVWKGTEEGIESEVLLDDLPIDTSTIERLRTVRKGFIDGRSDAEIAKSTAWAESSIRQLKKWWESYLISENPISWRLHIQSLVDLVATLRKRIINPKIGEQAYTGSSIWKWGNRDWRIAPRSWIYIVTPPNLDDEKILKPDYAYLPFLRAHIPNHPFWAQYKDLIMKASNLHDKIDDVIISLKKKDAKKAAEASSYQGFLYQYCYKHSWDPKKMPSPESLQPLDDDEINSCESIIAIISKFIPEYKAKLDEIENLLQRIWDDLDPYKTQIMIENGRCPGCPFNLLKKSTNA